MASDSSKVDEKKKLFSPPESVPLEPAARLPPKSILSPGTANPTTPPTATPIAVSVGPLSIAVKVGQSGTFSATASGGTPPYSYMWMEGSSMVGNAATFSISKSAVGSNKYYCIVKDAAASTQNSNIVMLYTCDKTSAKGKPNQILITVINKANNTPLSGYKIWLYEMGIGIKQFIEKTDKNGLAKFDNVWEPINETTYYRVEIVEPIQGRLVWLGTFLASNLDQQHSGNFTFYYGADYTH